MRLPCIVLAALVAESLTVACGDNDLSELGGDAGLGPQGDASGHVTHYDYRFDLTTRASHTTVTLRLDTAGNCVSLPLRVKSTADSFRVDGAPAVDASVTGDILRLCGRGKAGGDTMTLEVDAVVALATLEASQVGYSISTDSSAAHHPFHYLLSWVGGCDRFGPCDIRPDQFATYAFHVAHPADLMVRCSGRIAEVSATETTCDFDLPGGPTYSTFGFVAYPRTAWPVTDKGMWGSAHVTVYDRPETRIAAGIDPAYHGGFVAWMESTFGPYPYGRELRVLTAPTYWGGFEHPGNIVLNDGLRKMLGSPYANPLAHTLDHEIAHQWAGDQTTLATIYDFVWKESMAEYLAYVWEDMSSPATGLTTANAWKLFASGSRYFPVPGEQPALFDYYGDVYGQGPMILFRQIEVLSSREQVIAALKTVLGKPRALSVDEVVAALAATTGLDLDAYAAAWIHGTGTPAMPKIQVTVAPTSVHVVQTTAPGRRCKFHIALRGALPTEVFLVEVDTFHAGIDQTIALPPLAFTVTSSEIDPLRECLVGPATTVREAPRPRPLPWVL